jgi:hypothetical protein
MDVARCWLICAKDCAAGDVGYIDYMSVRAHWTAPTIDALMLTKTYVGPGAIPVTVGDPVRFDIEVQNVSASPVDKLPMTDVFDSECLHYVSAEPPPNNADPNTNQLLWYDLGPLQPGETRSVQVEFVATAPCDSTVNRAGISSAIDSQGMLVTALLAEAEVSIVQSAGPRWMHLPLIRSN